MFIVNYIVSIIIVIIGVVIGLGKQYELIAGYNTASKEEKAKINIEAYGKFMMRVFIAMAILIVLGTFIAQYFNIQWLEIWAIMIALIPGLTYLLIRGNSKKYTNKE